MGWVREVKVNLPHSALPDGDWADAHEVDTVRGFVDARQAGEAIISGFPKWTYPLLYIRQVLVFPFGLKGVDSKPDTDRLGIFPVVSQTARQLVGGFDDRHLDFRIVVDLSDGSLVQVVRLTTVIRRHNQLGRAYLAMVLPFHRLIIRSALRTLS